MLQECSYSPRGCEAATVLGSVPLCIACTISGYLCASGRKHGKVATRAGVEQQHRNSLEVKCENNLYFSKEHFIFKIDLS